MALCPFMSTPYVDKEVILGTTANILGSLTGTIKGTNTGGSGILDSKVTVEHSIEETLTGTIENATTTGNISYGTADKSGGIIVIECRQSQCALWYISDDVASCSLNKPDVFKMSPSAKLQIQTSLNKL